MYFNIVIKYNIERNPQNNNKFYNDIDAIEI